MDNMWQGMAFAIGLLAVIGLLSWDHPIDRNLRQAKDDAYLNNVWL